MSTRPPIVIRDAHREDAAALIRLWSDCAEASADGAEAFSQQALWREPEVAEAAEAIDVNLRSVDKRILVALLDGEVIGATVCDIRTLTPISMTKVLTVTEIQVSPRHRRKSVAATLLSAVADHGDAHACELVVAVIPAQSREPHRYLTKLGFSQIAIVRAINASKLRSRLSGKVTTRDTGKLIAVRRTLKRRQRTL